MSKEKFNQEVMDARLEVIHDLEKEIKELREFNKVSEYLRKELGEIVKTQGDKLAKITPWANIDFDSYESDYSASDIVEKIKGILNG